MRRWTHLLIDAKGSASAELAVIMPLFLALIFATLHLCTILWSAAQLHYAVEDAARCASVKSATSCASSGAIQTYAASHYRGPAVNPVFVHSTPACGNQVLATASYSLNYVVGEVAVPLSAKACYPA